MVSVGQILCYGSSVLSSHTTLIYIQLFTGCILVPKHTVGMADILEGMGHIMLLMGLAIPYYIQDERSQKARKFVL